MDKGLTESKEIHRSASYRVVLLKGYARTKLPFQHSASEIFLIVKKGQIRISFNNRADVELKSGGTFLIEPNTEHGLQATSDFEVIAISEGGSRIQYEYQTH